MALTQELLADEQVDGLTFSGGEPMAQAAGLAALARTVRAKRDVSVICFTGYRLARLRSWSLDSPAIRDLLAQVDVLIDGQYVAAHDNGRGLRGSTNQMVHHLSDRFAGSSYDFENRPRSAEIRIGERDVTLVGVPTRELLVELDRVLDSVAVTGLTPDNSRTAPRSSER
jgi:anaerobic ribonucleoside-triphosphate reductase activating protein